MNQTQRVGVVSELAFTKRCLELGYSVFSPVGVERFDILLNRASGYERVQIKTGRLKRGSIEFSTCSNAEGVGRKVSYDGCADSIGIFCPELERCYLVPLRDCSRSSGRLRVDPTLNNQNARVRWASTYEL